MSFYHLYILLSRIFILYISYLLLEVLMRYFKLFCINVLTIIILISLFTTFYYFDFINLNIYNFIKLFILLLSICICSFILCKEINTKGYIGGCIYSLIFIIPFILISLINSSFKLRLILYYLMIFLSSCVAGIFSKQTKKNNK